MLLIDCWRENSQTPVSCVTSENISLVQYYLELRGWRKEGSSTEELVRFTRSESYKSYRLEIRVVRDASSNANRFFDANQGSFGRSPSCKAPR
jgi:hypothetical protein